MSRYEISKLFQCSDDYVPDTDDEMHDDSDDSSTDGDEDTDNRPEQEAKSSGIARSGLPHGGRTRLSLDRGDPSLALGQQAQRAQQEAAKTGAGWRVPGFVSKRENVDNDFGGRDDNLASTPNMDRAASAASVPSLNSLPQALSQGRPRFASAPGESLQSGRVFARMLAQKGDFDSDKADGQ